MRNLAIEPNRRILIVDDNEAIHGDFKKILAGPNDPGELHETASALFGGEGESRPAIRCEIESAHQGREGLEKVVGALEQERPFSLAFVDMRMPPGWDGLETIQRLWREDPELQIVLCTAYSDYSWGDIIDRLGQSDGLLILKIPFDTAEVRQLAASLTEKWRLTRAAQLKVTQLQTMVEQQTAKLRREIEERKRAEEELRKKEEQLRQKHKLEAIGSLAGGIAHEFNNLLQAISGFTDFAMDKLQPDGEPYQDLKNVMSAADRAAEITAQLLNFSRQQPARKAPHDVNEIVAATVNMIRPMLGEHLDLDLSLAVDPGKVLADSGMITQALLNLCLNARDAMHAGGRIQITTRRGKLPPDLGAGEESPRPAVLASVIDAGSGMSPEVQRQIFDPFYTTKDVGEGTGLGLAVAYGTVQEHGGDIVVESKEGVGTKATIALPLLDEPAATLALPSDAPGNAPSGTETILVAEDEPLVRDVIVRILRYSGYKVLQAADGEDAVRVFQEHQNEISLLLLDVLMPRMTGPEAFGSIRRLEPDIPAVFCTGYNPSMEPSGLPLTENVPVLGKPVERCELLQTLRDTLGRPEGREASPCDKDDAPLVKHPG